MLTVTSIHVYPVKACGGLDLAEASATPRGLAHDRRWLITDDTGQFFTQRAIPHLGRVRPRIDDASLTLSFEGSEHRVPIALDAGPRMAVTVWRSTVDAIEHVASRRWISDVVGGAARLVYMPDDVERVAVPNRGGPPGIVSFADSMPLLLTTASSLADLNARAALKTPLVMRRFRPNVVVSGDAPFDEDTWHTLRAGEVELLSSGPCDRCVVTTLDPDTSERGVEPLRTLATFRKWDGKTWFGVHAIPRSPGRIRVGDPIHVHERFAPPA